MLVCKTQPHLGRSRVNKRIESTFKLVHSDVCGPCPVVSKNEHKYFVTIVDDFSRMTWIYLRRVVLKCLLTSVYSMKLKLNSVLR